VSDTVSEKESKSAASRVRAEWLSPIAAYLLQKLDLGSGKNGVANRTGRSQLSRNDSLHVSR